MKVILCVNTAWNVANFRMGLLTAIQAQGCAVGVIAPDDEYVSIIEQANIRFIPVPMDNQGVNPFRDGLLFARLYFILRRERPDVLLCYTVKPNIFCSLAARCLGISVINNVAGFGSAFIADNWLSRLVEKLYKIAFSSSKKVFFQNDVDKSYFIQHGLVQEALTDRLPGSGINLSSFSFYDMPEKEGCITFLMVARLLRDKGVIEYIEAARQVKRHFPGVRFQLLGATAVKNPTAISRKEVDSWVNQGIVEYLGVRDDVQPFIVASDCVVLPSYREGLSRALLEAAATGRPIIASNVPGCSDVVDDGINGYLCRPRDAVDLAEKIKAMIELSQSERAAMGLRGRHKVEREFDEQLVIHAYLHALRQQAIE